MPQVERVLIVEDDRSVCAVVGRLARSWGAEVLEAHTVSEAITQLDEKPDLVIADYCLPDGTAVEIAEVATRGKPSPSIVVLSGAASASEAFRLAQLGVRGYLQKPISLALLTAQVDEALNHVPSLAPLAAAAVGHTPMRELQSSVRYAMVDQALALEQGSRSGAARLLKISRQAVQQIVRDRASV